MKVTTRQLLTIELDNEAVEHVFMERLNQLCGGENTYLTKEGKVEDWEDTGHGSGLTTEVKNPVSTLIAALKLREALKELARKRAAEAEKRRRSA